MKLLDHYDLIVMGEHPSALLAGFLAASRGETVLLAPIESAPKSEVESLCRSRPAYLPEWGTHVYSGGSTTGDPNDAENWPDPAREGLIYRRLKQAGVTTQALDTMIGRAPTLGVMTSHERVFWSRSTSYRTWHRQLNVSTRESREHWSNWIESVAQRQSAWSTLLSELPKSLQESKRNRLGFLNRETPTTLQLKLRKRGSKSARLARAEWDGAEWIRALAEVNRLSVNSDPALEAVVRYAERSICPNLRSLAQWISLEAKNRGAHLAPTSVSQVFVKGQVFEGIQLVGEAQVITAHRVVAGCPRSTFERLEQESKADSGSNVDSLAQRTVWVSQVFRVDPRELPDDFSGFSVWSEPGAPLLYFECHRIDKERAYFVTRSTLRLEGEATGMMDRRLGRMKAQTQKCFPFVKFEWEAQTQEQDLASDWVYADSGQSTRRYRWRKKVIPLWDDTMTEWGAFGPSLAALLI